MRSTQGKIAYRHLLIWHISYMIAIPFTLFECSVGEVWTYPGYGNAQYYLCNKHKALTVSEVVLSDNSKINNHCLWGVHWQEGDQRDTNTTEKRQCKEGPSSFRGLCLPQKPSRPFTRSTPNSFYPQGERWKLWSISFALFPPSCFLVWVVLLVSCQHLLSLGNCCETGGQAHGDVRKHPEPGGPRQGSERALSK